MLRCSSIFPAPLSSGNAIIGGDWKKGGHAFDDDKPPERLIILVLLSTSNEEGSLVAHTARCVFELLLAQPSLQPLPLREILLDMGSGRRVVLLLAKPSLCSGLSFLHSLPSVRWDLPQAIWWSVPPPSPSPLESGIHK